MVIKNSFLVLKEKKLLLSVVQIDFFGSKTSSMCSIFTSNVIFQSSFPYIFNPGVVEVLISLSKSAKSDSSREMISRVFYAVCSEKKHRGAVVQQGGVKALLPLTTSKNILL